ncbi:MAG: elongation factor Ts [Bdellovibrionaceae bacterium]|nr:elongation factor Ts [Pseudobdellovibrionaceae bacterium]
MSISATMVRDLREKTSAGMLDCKKALEETKGDFEAAVEWLRKKGLASAAKKSDRLASEGVVVAAVKGNSGALLEVNSETDFVAKNDMFKAFVKESVESIVGSATAPADIAALSDTSLKSGKVGDQLKEIIAKIGENIVLRRFERYDSKGLVHTYIHGDGKIGVMVDVETTKPTADEVRTFANDICLHVAAMNPLALRQEEVPADIVAKEREILKGKAIEQGKKPEMLDKILEGQIRKFLAESCLLEQAFVKNPDLKVREYMAETGKKVGDTSLNIKRFLRFELGEGLQKRSNNFAEEVAAQAKGH